jgi:hypothetical protein
MLLVNTLRTFFLSLPLGAGIAAADGTDWPYYGSIRCQHEVCAHNPDRPW